MAEKTLTVTGESGLHARPATLLVQTASKYNCEALLTYNGRTVNLKSIMGVLSLAVPGNAEVTLKVTGEDEQAALNALEETLKNAH